MKHFQPTLLPLLAALPSSHAFWRLGCGIAQRGRIDPIITPGGVSGHVHMLSGATNISPFSDSQSLQSANCTSCTVQADKSAYWTPQLFYQFANGSFTMVPNGGMIIYYLGRGDDAANIVPFPPGYKVLSGDPFVRSYNQDNLTYLNGRPIADRASFACIDYDHPSNETPGMTNTNCPDGLRAQMHFPSCWDGVNAFLPNSAHVTYMSQIDNGKCPPTHPKTLPHLFFEIYYSVDRFNGQSGKFVFAQGDTTGYGFHGDFMSGWDDATLNSAVKECLVGNPSGVTEQCSVFKASNDDAASAHCPPAPPLVNEQVEGILPSLPGCNPVTSGPERAIPPTSCSVSSSLDGGASSGGPTGGNGTNVAANAAANAAPAASSATSVASSAASSFIVGPPASTGSNVASAAHAAASNIASMVGSASTTSSAMPTDASDGSYSDDSDDVSDSTSCDAPSATSDGSSSDGSNSTSTYNSSVTLAARKVSFTERSEHKHGRGYHGHGN